jgi:16S rRNA (guanine(966)-N(2))-methyltransferase RsmD
MSADAGRVIAGAARGIRLRAPGGATRPLGDRVKQTLFAILEPDLRAARVADLFSGSGAAGIEALSRGAATCWFVEADPGAIRTIQDNLARTGLAGPGAIVVRHEVLGWLDRGAAAAGPLDVVLADPPYDRPDVLLAVLARLGAPVAPGAAAVVADDGLVVAKHYWRTELPANVGLLASERVRRFGETALTFYRRRPGVASGGMRGAE